jgi:N utilization substance protein B
MKTASDPRHKFRRKIVKELFANEFAIQEVTSATKLIMDQSIKIDLIIEKAAPEWPISKINKIDLAILRLAVYEIKNKKEPAKVIIDEAIELAKEYGSEASPAFINGVLGTICKNLMN